MATRIYGLSRGENQDQVTEGVGSATAADNIELTIDLAVGLTRNDVLLALEHFRNYILSDVFPPA